MKKTDDHRFWRFGLPMLLAFWMLTMVSCASDDAPTGSDGQKSVGVSLAFDVSVLRGGTRMSDAVTQQPNASYRGIQDLYLFPFDVEGVIGSNEVALTGNVLRPYVINEAQHYYMDDNSPDVRIGTVSFLCYARAVPSNVSSGDARFVNGSIMATIPEGEPNTSKISFAPEPIYTAKTGEIPTVHANATAIATYLTDIALAIKNAGKDDFYFQFINNGHPIACSSTNVEKLGAWAESKGVTLPTPRPDEVE